MNPVRRIWQQVSPNFMLTFVRYILEPKDYRERRRAVLKHYRDVEKHTLPAEVREGLRYLRCHKYTPLPYKWTRKYDNLIPEVFRDAASQCNYIIFQGKKMFFPKDFSSSKAVWAARAAMREQDPESPHLYLDSDFQVEEGSIVVDAGVAEGNFSLSVIEKAKRLYIVECDPGWMSALRLTFEPWKEKVVFVEKYMSDISGDFTTSIDDLAGKEEGGNFFIKLDIEGHEQKALAGMKKLAGSGSKIKMNVCTYHRPNDHAEIQEILESYRFSCRTTEGYVLFFQPGEEPAFRRVLIRAEKK